MSFAALISILKQLAPSTITAFMGAFFAFLFMRLADSIKEAKERRSLHIQSFTLLQFLLGDIATAIQSNAFQFGYFIQAHTQTVPDMHLMLTPNRPHALPFRDDALTHLKNTDLLNDILSFRVKIQQSSEDIVAFWDLHEKIRAAALSTADIRTFFKDYSSQSAQAAQLLSSVGDDLFKDTVHLLAHARVLFKRDTHWFRKYLYPRIPINYPKNMEKLVGTETQILHAEYVQTYEKNAARIARIIKQPSASN